MIEMLAGWYSEIVLLAALVVFALIVWKGGKRYLLYALFGALFGFIFNYTSEALGYLEYLAPAQIFQPPVAILIAEAFAVPIAIFLFEKLIIPLLEREKEEEEGISLAD